MTKWEVIVVVRDADDKAIALTSKYLMCGRNTVDDDEREAIRGLVDRVSVELWKMALRDGRL